MFDKYYYPLILMFLGGIIPMLFKAVENYINNKNKRNISGIWFSLTDTREGDNKFIEDELMINESLFYNYKFQNILKPNGFNYSGAVTSYKDDTVAGDWKSENLGATAKGTFMFQISSQGDSMYGYYIGFDEFNNRKWHRWVLSRKRDDLREKLRTLNKFIEN